MTLTVRPLLDLPLTFTEIKEAFLAGTYDLMLEEIHPDYHLDVSQVYLDIAERVAQIFVTTDLLMIAAPSYTDWDLFLAYAANFPKYSYYMKLHAQDLLTAELIVLREWPDDAL